MKLTKAHKAEFVRAVLADVPTKNYPTQAEDLSKAGWPKKDSKRK